MKRIPFKNPNMGSYVLLMTVLPILLVGILAGYLSMRELYQQKLRDTLAILYLNLESDGSRLAARLNSVPASRKPDLLLERVPRGGFSDQQLAQALGSSEHNDLLLMKKCIEKSEHDLGSADWLVFNLGSRIYLCRHAGEKIQAWAIERRTWSEMFLKVRQNQTFYLINMGGDLIASSDLDITPLNIIQRPLVRKFIEGPFLQGQLELQSQEGGSRYGFYQILSGTNLVVFSEINDDAIRQVVKKSSLIFSGYLALILAFVVLIVRISIQSITGPLSSLTRLTEKVSLGDFESIPSLPDKGPRDIRALTESFGLMIKNLHLRDIKIQELSREREEKLRMSAELALAEKFQQHLMQHPKLSIDFPIAVATSYVPAEELGGDWYSYVCDEERKELIAVITDVSGHGIGSGLFTALIAGLFVEQTRKGIALFDPVYFMQSVNSVLLSLSQGNCHCSMTIVRFRTSAQEIDMYNAGHMPSILVSGGEKSAQFLRLPSSLLGLEESPKIAEKTLPFPKSSLLLMYTDGLTEALSDQDKAYGARRLKAIIEKVQETSGVHAVNRIHTDWQNYTKGTKVQDDLCLIGVKAS